MARRPPGGLPALLISIAALLAACSGDTGEGSTTATSARPGSTDTTLVSTTTTTTMPPTTTPHPPSPTTAPVAPGTEVLVPHGAGPFPAVVLVHGGGWVVGTPALMSDLARYLTGEGYLTVNTSYRLSLNTPGFPGAIEDVSCAVAYAASHPESNGQVTIIGHSAGAHIGAIVSLAADTYDDECQPADAGTPQRFVGLAGPYDIARLGGILVPFFGVEQDIDPALWASGNPLNLIDNGLALEVLLIHGDADAVVPTDFSEAFAARLDESGVTVTVEILPGVNHSTITSQEVVGRIIADWIGD